MIFLKDWIIYFMALCVVFKEICQLRINYQKMYNFCKTIQCFCKLEENEYNKFIIYKPMVV